MGSDASMGREPEKIKKEYNQNVAFQLLYYEIGSNPTNIYLRSELAF